MRIPLFVELTEGSDEVRLVFADKGYIIINDTATFNHPLGDVVARAIKGYTDSLNDCVTQLKKLTQ